MNGQKKNYDRYLRSLEATPGPVSPPADKTIDLRGIYEYIKRTGKKASDMSDEEYKPFIIPLKRGSI